MSKKYYIMIADVLFRTGASVETCTELAAEFARDNKLFDTARFLKACGH
jgi:hypothetical protein